MALAVDFARRFLPFLFINMVNNLGHAFLRGMGSMKLLLLSTAVGSVSQVLATKLLAPALGMEGVYLGLVIAWGTEAVFFLALYLLRYRTPALIVKRARESK
jgi:O-antigen/teichoic acid export membrane protein